MQDRQAKRTAARRRPLFSDDKSVMNPPLKFRRAAFIFAPGPRTKITYMKRHQLLSLLALALALTARSSFAAADGPYHLLKEIPVGDPSSWDYLSVDEAGRRLYVSHGTEVVVIDIDKDTVVGKIPNTPRVHGFAVAPDLGRGVASNGGENKASVVDLKTLETIVKLDTGTNPDGFCYEPGQHEVYLFNGGSASATVIDPKAAKVVATIPLGGKPEFATADAAAGRVYDNLEDKSAVVVIDTKTHAVVADLADHRRHRPLRHGD